MEDVGDDRGNSGPTERVVAGRRIGKDPAEGKDVALLCYFLAVQLLRRHVAKSANDDVGGGDGGGVHALGDAEVDDARAVVGKMTLPGLRSR